MILERPDLAKPAEPRVAATLALGLLLERKDAKVKAALDQAIDLLTARPDEDRE